MNRPRMLIIGTACALAITVAGLAVVLGTAHSHSRSELQHNFKEREATAAALFSALLSASTHPGGVPKELSQPRVSVSDLHGVLAAQASEGLRRVDVLDAAGNELASASGRVPTPISATELRTTARLAARGGSYIGDVIGTGSSSTLNLATAYPTPY